MTNVYDFQSRRQLTGSERAKAATDIITRYHAGEGSASSLAGDYVGIKTSDVYRMLAEEKKVNPGRLYNWQRYRGVAKVSGEIDAVKDIVYRGRQSGMSARDIRKQIAEQTGFVIKSDSTIYRMSKKAAVGDASAVA